MRSWEEVGVVNKAVRWGKGKKKYFCRKYLHQKYFRQKYFRQKYFHQKYFCQKYFLQKYYRQKNFCKKYFCQKYFRKKIFSQKIFSSKIFFKKNFSQNFFWTKYCCQKYFHQKYFPKKIHQKYFRKNTFCFCQIFFKKKGGGCPQGLGWYRAIARSQPSCLYCNKFEGAKFSLQRVPYLQMRSQFRTFYLAVSPSVIGILVCTWQLRLWLILILRWSPNFRCRDAIINLFQIFWISMFVDVQIGEL